MSDFTKADIERIKSSSHIVFFTGAGMSAESGISTFRGKDGIWNKFKPEELANFNAFMKNPRMVWEWYNYRRDIVRQALPNAGHIAIAEFQKYVPKVTVITQNIDNLHKRAGSKKIFELHGNIERNYCVKCKTFYNDIELKMEIPKCKCGGLIRPDVVWFGEYLPEDQFNGAEIAASECDLFFVVGTSAVVYPAASLIYTAKHSGAFITEINIEKTEISSLSNNSFIGQAGKILPEILEKVKE
jgi:NAD-dependent deacetylase